MSEFNTIPIPLFNFSPSKSLSFSVSDLISAELPLEKFISILRQLKIPVINDNIIYIFLGVSYVTLFKNDTQSYYINKIKYRPYIGHFLKTLVNWSRYKVIIVLVSPMNEIHLKTIAKELEEMAELEQNTLQIISGVKCKEINGVYKYEKNTEIVVRYLHDKEYNYCLFIDVMKTTKFDFSNISEDLMNVSVIYLPLFNPTKSDTIMQQLTLPLTINEKNKFYTFEDLLNSWNKIIKSY